METYDVNRDQDEHDNHVDTVLDYHQAMSVMKWKKNILTLKGVVMIWFKTR